MKTVLLPSNHIIFFKVIENNPGINLKGIKHLLKEKDLDDTYCVSIIKGLNKYGYIKITDHIPHLPMGSAKFFVTNKGKIQINKLLANKELCKISYRLLPGRCSECGQFEYELTYFKKNFVCGKCLNKEDCSTVDINRRYNDDMLVYFQF